MRNSLFGLYGLIALVSFASLWSCSQGEEAVYQTVPNIDESVATMSSSGMTNLVIPASISSGGWNANDTLRHHLLIIYDHPITDVETEAVMHVITDLTMILFRFPWNHIS